MAMLWDSINKESAQVMITYLKNQNGLVSSPNGIIEENGEIKLNYTWNKMAFLWGGGIQVPYKNVCVNHIHSIVLEKFYISTQQCHLFGLLLALKFSLLGEMTVI